MALQGPFCHIGMFRSQANSQVHVHPVLESLSLKFILDHWIIAGTTSDRALQGRLALCFQVDSQQAFWVWQFMHLFRALQVGLSHFLEPQNLLTFVSPLNGDWGIPEPIETQMSLPGNKSLASAWAAAPKSRARVGESVHLSGVDMEKLGWLDIGGILPK